MELRLRSFIWHRLISIVFILLTKKRAAPFMVIMDLPITAHYIILRTSIATGGVPELRILTLMVIITAGIYPVAIRH